MQPENLFYNFKGIMWFGYVYHDLYSLSLA